MSGAIQVREFCEMRNGPAGTFLIMDIDGGEKELLDPAKVPELGFLLSLLEVRHVSTGVWS